MPAQPQVPSSVSGVGRSTGRFSQGSLSRYGYNETENPQDKQLRRLALMQGLDQEAQSSDQSSTANIIGMLHELYGINENETNSPIKDAALQAETRYRNAMADEYGVGKEGRAMQDESKGLSYLYPQGIPPFLQQALLQKHGLPTAAPTNPAAAAGSFDPGSGGAGKPVLSTAQNLGHIAGMFNEASLYTNPGTTIPYQINKIYQNWDQIHPQIQATLSDFMKGLTQ